LSVLTADLTPNAVLSPEALTAAQAAGRRAAASLTPAQKEVLRDILLPSVIRLHEQNRHHLLNSA
jgi:hypothetical protein